MTPELLEAQERVFARAFAQKDLEIARPLYHPEVVYQSPTVRLYGWPARIEGVDRTLEFIALTVMHTHEIVYQAVEQVVFDEGRAAFVRVHFDWAHPEGGQLRSDYVVLYRYDDTRIGRQELYYDPSGRLERL